MPVSAKNMGYARMLRHALQVVVAIAAFVALSTPTASAHRGRVFGGSFGESGSGAGQLSLMLFSNGEGVALGGSGVAVNEVTHEVFVADSGNQRVDEFTSTGEFVRAWGWGVRDGVAELQVCTETTGCRAGISGGGAGQFEIPAQVAVDDKPGGEGDVYVSDYEGSNVIVREPRIQKFTAQGELISSWGQNGRIGESTTPANIGHISGLAVTESGELIVGSNSGIFKFNRATGAYIARLGRENTSTADGFPVDSNGDFYASNGGRVLNGEFGGWTIVRYNAEGTPLGPGGPGFFPGTFFELRTRVPFYASGLAVSRSGELYVDEGDAIQVVSSAPSCAPLCAPSATFTSSQLVEGAGLAVDSQSASVYIAEVASDKIVSIVPEPPAAPLVEAGSETVSDVSGDSAVLEASVNPRSEPSEVPTSYRFEYTPEDRFDREGFAGASRVPVPSGLLSPSFEAEPVTARIQGLTPATAYRYRVVAENAISRKEGRPSEGERDGVGGEVARTFSTQPLGGLSLPDGRAWELVSPPDKHGALLGFYYTAGVVQAAADGEAVTYMASAPTEAEPPGNSNQTQVLSSRGAGVSSWTSRDITTPNETADGFKEGGAQEYRFFSSDLSLSIVNPFGPFDASLSAQASEQTAFLRSDFPAGDPGEQCGADCYRPLVTGATGYANVPEGTVFGRGCIAGGDCGPQFVAATPDASHVILSSAAPLSEGAPPYQLYEWFEGQLQLVSVLPSGEPSPRFSSLGTGEGAVARSALSGDGSRVVWGAGNALYLRDMVREETVQLGTPGAVFQDASSDDSRVFFTVAGDLYEYEAPLGEALSTGHLMNLVPAGGVVGFIPGVSEDGSSVYFVSTHAIVGVEANMQGEKAVAGSPNLYVERGGTIKLIAVLADGDQHDWMADPANLSLVALQRLTSRVSPDGRWLAFMSDMPLTGYDNRDVSTGERDEEVFLYDSQADNGTGGLVCASCDPTGARPTDVVGDGITKEPLVDPLKLWTFRGLAGNVPGWITAGYQPRYLADSGRLFFDSADALVPSDTNGVEDVYEYEPPGVGDCTTQNVFYSVRANGCIDLVSSGVSKEESAFIDASETGDDVFFFTAAQLTAADSDSTLDVYDARVDGGFPVPVPPPACEGDSCQSPVAAPTDQTPGSLTYHGSGNPVSLPALPRKTKKKVVCATGRKIAKGKCVKTPRRKQKGKAGGRKADSRRGKSPARRGRS